MESDPSRRTTPIRWGRVRARDRRCNHQGQLVDATSDRSSHRARPLGTRHGRTWSTCRVDPVARFRTPSTLRWAAVGVLAAEPVAPAAELDRYRDRPEPVVPEEQGRESRRASQDPEGSESGNPESDRPAPRSQAWLLRTGARWGADGSQETPLNATTSERGNWSARCGP